MKRRERRNWSDDEKHVICAQTRLPGVSVAQVARRYDVNANQVFNWLKDQKFASSPDDEDMELFLPVEFIESTSADPDNTRDPGEIVVELACGHRLKIRGSYSPDALAALIRKLTP
ncbi:MAG: transposase [Paracoccaceae bacterium]